MNSYLMKCPHMFYLLIWSLIMKLLLRGYLDFNQLQAASIPFFDQ